MFKMRLKEKRQPVPDSCNRDCSEDVCEQPKDRHCWAQCRQLQGASTLQSSRIGNDVKVRAQVNVCCDDAYPANADSVYKTHDRVR